MTWASVAIFKGFTRGLMTIMRSNVVTTSPFFKYSFPDNIQTDKELVDFIKSDLESKVDFKPGNRIYIVRRSIDKEKDGKTTGGFIIGKRKANPWEGFGTKTENTVDE